MAHRRVLQAECRGPGMNVNEDKHQILIKPVDASDEVRRAPHIPRKSVLVGRKRPTRAVIANVISRDDPGTPGLLA